MNVYILVLILSSMLILLVVLLLQDQNNYLSYKQAQGLISEREFDTRQSDREEMPGMGALEIRLGKNLLPKLFLPVIVISMLSILLVGPLLTNVYLGIVLGLIISLAYIVRLYYHLALSFRTKLLLQLERVLRAIRNQLSSGTTLDYAVTSVLDYVRNDAPIGQELARFVRSIEANFLESFPQWLKFVRNRYQLVELTEAAQLLALELKYASNQEQAFLTAINSINARQRSNQRSQNTIFVTFLSLDFMVLAFFGVLFYVIPSFAISAELSWWASPRREWIVFVSGMILWLAYFMAVAFTARRLA